MRGRAGTVDKPSTDGIFTTTRTPDGSCGPVVPFSTGPTVTAYDAAGARVVTVVGSPIQRTPETLVLTGPGIVTVDVDAPSDEVLLMRLCWAA